MCGIFGGGTVLSSLLLIKETRESLVQLKFALTACQTMKLFPSSEFGSEVTNFGSNPFCGRFSSNVQILAGLARA
jgi:hypothetical protein